MPQFESSANPLETTSRHLEDAPEPMEVDKAPMGRTLRKRKEKVAKHLKRGANEKEIDSFRKRVLRIPLEKPFEEAYFTHRLNSREIVRDLELQIVKALVPVACNCGAEYETEYSASIETHTPTSIDSANQKSIANHLEESIDSSPDDWENDYYNPNFAVDTATPSDGAKLHTEEYDEDYEEERATEYISIHAEEDRLLHHSYGIRNATSIDRTIPTLIDTYHDQTQSTQASTDISIYTLIDNGVDHEKEGNYSISSWADDQYHESYAQKRLDRRCDDIYFPIDLTMSSLTSQIEAIQREIVEIQRYIAHRPEASTSIDRRNNISTDSRRRTTIDGATTRGRLVPKLKSDMSDTNNHGEEITDDAHATLIRISSKLRVLETDCRRYIMKLQQ
ncbi:hypothetical protein DY000_02014960 [Brassica cretica]|uniref:Uncharacterized protein n=1 Tax=Brassica cretica TaxID=69181 RepID=A0ABQ7D4R1_BRACR|nr:hypothetical protein DY000_02014960 [Brassica cretica]